MARYTMTISRMTVDKLGIKLYDSVSAVVAELVANSYDADATSVRVRVPFSHWLSERNEDGQPIDKGYSIEVTDDGHGMSPEEANRYFLKVGADRRKKGGRGPVSPRFKRKVMGRKGVGKLAPFGICRRIEVRSAGGPKTAKGYEVSHFILDYDGIAVETDEPYEPQVGPDDGTFQAKSGTSLRLTEFNYRRMPDPETFNRQLARRFGLQSKHWRIRVEDNADLGGEFTVGELDIDLLPGTRINLKDRPIVLDDGGATLPLTGWVGISAVSYRNEEMVGVRVYARGKIVATTRDFGLSSGFTGEQTIRSYLVGEVHAEWLDDDDYDDLVRTDRQDILWGDERGMAFQRWGKKLLGELGELARRPIRKRAWEKFLEVSKLAEEAKRRFHDKNLVDEAMETGKLLGGLASLDELDDEAHVKRLAELVLTIAPHKLLVRVLRDVGADAESPLDALSRLLGQARVAELASLGQIADERIGVIDQLRATLDAGSDERTLQVILEQAPWLINAQWTLLGANRSLTSLRDAFEKWYRREYRKEITTSALEDESRRPDFVLLHVANGLRIVEIKRPNYSITSEEWERLLGYHEALERFLGEHERFAEAFGSKVHSTLVCDVTTKLAGSHRKAMEKMRDDGVLDVRKWRDFLGDTERFHEEFLAVARPQGQRRPRGTK